MKAKRIIAIIAILAMALTCMTACGKDDGKYTIGICQLVTHEALDAATQGFKDAVIAGLGEENVKFIEGNGAGENDTCVTIVNNFVSKNVDLIMANATGALQAAANATTTIPILGTSVTDYGVALEIDDFSGTVGGNISGTSDLAPLNDQAQMVLDLVPTAKTVGLLYCSAEANSAYQVKIVREYLEEKGIKVEDYSFSASNDVAIVAATAAAKCDAIYIPTDNTAVSCASTIRATVAESKVPIVTGDTGSAKICGIATLSSDYYNIGKKAGEMAVQVLKGEADISEMSIQYDETPVPKYNKAICEELNITVPENYVELT
ncbi:MAG: ABC transporter substrate-binding protein [Clostridia bacterium]|nr:ABC transporter substrate-binding protein [Clostridia bacterium]